MNELRTLTLFLSWACNFACNHCGFSCGPERREKLDIGLAVNCIDQASKMETVEMIAFSGGEPFLFYDVLAALMQYAHESGFRTGVVTNCFWADTEAIAFSRLKQLRIYGLDEINISVDDYHLKYVDIKNIRNVVKAATAIGIKIGINILMNHDSHIRKSNLHSILEVPKSSLDNKEIFWIKESSPIMTGRAKKCLSSNNFKYYHENALINNPCEYVIKNIIITPDGSAYACCGFGGATADGPAPELCGGNVYHNSLEEIHHRFMQNILLSIISVRGPYIMLKMVEEKHPEIDFRKSYVSNCDVCQEIFCNQAVRQAVGELLTDMYSELTKASTLTGGVTG